ncbi:PQQ-dependent sugar dehydrogenase [Pseudidiomarina sp. 1APP75-32.1]|uniref:PQQ-dependent sugar dehydrogenase n=2 Tax=Pseudidiomarina terrestris TaxID=2820060 RepID=A0AAW7R289_9GAMM|nr:MULTISPECIES: PQQ-dependent sugar dehydrogenase [unclassified Pseudidiomarina]MDN7125310.1 PQQ-dependent sugar dehydrogenase [Pseudidiomarina sp. 1APP75-32.1]MDN7130069.1 PQQ-dependent sugar dehydrogenase [Pseudidiomarina sp. 1APR75-15]MDN7135574.1 PQQ-dependent sugar dehydrogenase [Pseudidiomarina sp. 1ASP75-5]
MMLQKIFKTSTLALISTAALCSTLVTTSYAAEGQSERHKFEVTTVAEGLSFPWGIAFLPNGEALITEKSGSLRRVGLNGVISEPITGVPDVVYKSQGGLLDVALDPDFADNSWVYLSYSEADPEGGEGNSTAVARGKLFGNNLQDVEVIFRGAPKYKSNAHFGSRLAFSADGYLFITLGDRYSAMDDAQTLDNHHGKIVRIWPDGAIPEDNPFVNTEGALPEIWSYGHRNVQGAAMNPMTDELWTIEHGPKGGDEVNIPVAGGNYGWPVATYGVDYDGSIISEKTHVEGTLQPFYYWVPSIATSNAIFYTGSEFPAWQGDLLVSALKASKVARLDLQDGRMMHEEALFGDVVEQRIRDIEQGPDGAIYLITDDRNGKLLRITNADD